MSISKILANKETDAADKLSAIAEIVAKARDGYGNKDAEIPSPMVQTVHGAMNFNHLTEDTKVAMLGDEVQKIKAAAVECFEQNSAVNMNKKIEELIAINPLFTNIAAGTKFDYI